MIADWRTAADPDDLREYDGFGPWISTVKDHVDVPRRFRPWWPELVDATHLLKVPRPFDRAQIRPGMDLYESLIAVFPDRMCVFRADGQDIHRRDVPRAEVVGSARYTNLLLARWSLLLADGEAVTVDYNSVSHPTIAEVDRYLLSADEHGEAGTATPTASAHPTDHYFRSLILSLNAGAHDRAVPVHVDEPGEPCLTEKKRRRRSAGRMLLASRHDLVIITRGRSVMPLFRRADYAVNTVRLPFRRMTSFEIRTPEATSPASFTELVITSDRQVTIQPVLAPPGAVVELLTSRGVPRA